MLHEIFNYLKLGDTLHSSGMPTADQIATLGQEGIQVVVNLATPKSEGWLKDEEAQVTTQGIPYFGIAVDWEKPTMDQIYKFSAVLERYRYDRVLVHCQANYRVTAFVAIYRVIFLGWSEKNAYAEILKIWNPEEYPVWRKFIEKGFRAQS